MLHFLPPELLASILESFYYNTASRTPDYLTLLSCALVHPSWTDTAQSFLFRKVVYQKSRALAELLDAPPTSRLESLLQYTRILDVGLTTITNEHLHPEDCTETVLPALLARCPQLVDISLRFHGVFQLDFTVSSTIQSLIRTKSLSIRALSVLDCSVQSTIVYELLALFPFITSLTLGMEIASAPLSPPIPGLELLELVFYRSLDPATITWLLASSTTSLRTLELRDPIYPGVDVVLANYGPHIRTLRMMQYIPRAAKIIQSCTNLHELILLGVPAYCPLPQLPPTIEHFAFMDQSWASSFKLNHIVEAVRALPRLRTLRCDHHTQSHADFASLQALCKEREILLLATSPKLWTALTG